MIVKRFLSRIKIKYFIVLVSTSGALILLLHKKRDNNWMYHPTPLGW